MIIHVGCVSYACQQGTKGLPITTCHCTTGLKVALTFPNGMSLIVLTPPSSKGQLKFRFAIEKIDR